MVSGRAILRGALALALVLGAPAGVQAESWGGITPGTSTIDDLRGRYGPPSKELREKLEGYDTTQWVYEGVKAPSGVTRLTVHFGLLGPGGYRPEVVRDFVVVPHRRVFSRVAVLDGWGRPDRVGTDEGRTFFFYSVGLVVYFDDAGEDARSMYFTLPQSAPPPATK